MAALHRKLAAARAERDEVLQQLQAGLNELQAAYEDKLRSLVAENDRLQAENAKLRAGRRRVDDNERGAR